MNKKSGLVTYGLVLLVCLCIAVCIATVSQVKGYEELLIDCRSEQMKIYETELEVVKARMREVEKEELLREIDMDDIQDSIHKIEVILNSIGK